MSKVGVLVMRKRNWYLTSNIQKRWSSCCCSVTKNDTCYGVRPCYVTFAWITRSERPKDAKERCPKSIQLEVRPQKSPRLLVFYIDDSKFLWQQLLFVVIPGSRPMHVAVPQLVESLSKPTGKKIMFEVLYLINGRCCCDGLSLQLSEVRQICFFARRLSFPSKNHSNFRKYICDDSW